MEKHSVVSHDEWIEARKRLLAEEKEFTRRRDELTKRRQALPWERIEKNYVFDGPAGKRSLADLFHGKSQLIVYHFMFDADWDAGCKSCSFWADNFDGIDVHLAQRDISFVAVSRAPFPKLQAYRTRMGWSFAWFSSHGSDFNHDFGVGFTPDEMASGATLYNYATIKPPVSEMVGISVFFKDDGESIFHTYSAYSRGVDMVNGAYHYMDLAPKGRDEAELPYTQAWVQRHDEYAGG